MTAASCDANLVEICASLGIGTPQGTPHPVTGGLLHRMWRFETDSGIFAVKVLNAEIMTRPHAKRNYRISERVANIAHRNGIHAVLSKAVGNDPWIEINGKYVMVFDCVEGQTLLPEQCSSEHARRIGEVLFRLHNLDVVIDDLKPPTVSTIPEETWKCHIEKARQGIACWGFPFETVLRDVLNWSRLYGNTLERIGKRFAVSHRDLDSKNVIWTTENTPYLIDWESAGYVNPTVELIEGALNWSRNQDGTTDKERFQTLIQAYLGAGGTLYGNVLGAVYGTLGGTLGWLEYNMRRSVDEGVFNSDERELGQREVRQTVHELKIFNDVVYDYAKWIHELCK